MPRYAGVVAHNPQARPRDPGRERQPTRKSRWGAAAIGSGLGCVLVVGLLVLVW